MRKEDLMAMNLQFFAEDAGEVGANEAAPAEQSEEAVSDGEVEEGENEAPAEPQPQTPETNAAFADMRRKMQAAERRAAQIDSIVATQFGNFKNPETGKPIRNAEDYFEALAAQERVQAKEDLRQANIDPALIDRVIANSPVIRQAEEATAELNNMRAQQRLDADYKEILALDPSLNSVEDILNDPNLPLMAQRVATGMSLVDAYKLVNFEKLSNLKGKAAKQAAINEVKGKNHLSTGAPVNVGSSGEDIPANLLESFKENFPDKSMKELKALYNGMLKSRQ